MEETHTGGCACGAVRYRVVGKPNFVAVCHCKFCQARTGSTHAQLVYFRKGAVISLSGQLIKKRHESDESGRWIETESCKQCGASVTWTLELVPSWRGFEGSSFDNNKSFPCRVHQWTDSADPTTKINPTDTRFPKQAPFTTAQLEKL